MYLVRAVGASHPPPFWFQADFPGDKSHSGRNSHLEAGSRPDLVSLVHLH
jgi:hypothetical protein